MYYFVFILKRLQRRHENENWVFLQLFPSSLADRLVVVMQVLINIMLSAVCYRPVQYFTERLAGRGQAIGSVTQ
jgi:hypothetical protein